MNDRLARRNFRLAVGNGVLFNIGETFMDTATVLTLFVGRLTDRAWVVGFAGSITDLGWYLPQILTIHFLERQTQRLPVYRAMAIVRLLALSGVLASVLFLGEREPKVRQRSGSCSPRGSISILRCYFRSRTMSASCGPISKRLKRESPPGSQSSIWLPLPHIS